VRSKDDYLGIRRVRAIDSRNDAVLTPVVLEFADRNGRAYRVMCQLVGQCLDTTEQPFLTVSSGLPKKD